jgi:LPS export ABC transporter protein LptC
LRTATLSRVLSWLAAVVGVGFVVTFLVQAGLFQSLLPRPEVAIPVVQPNHITAESSTVTGVDRQRQPYEVKAKRGWQDEKTPNLVYLELPEGHFRRGGGAQYTITAQKGRYDTRAKSLDLEGDVVLAQQDRFTVRMQSANIAVDDKKLVSNSKVEARFGTGGTVDANAMQITDDGDRILFLNGVRARFTADPGKGDMKP